MRRECAYGAVLVSRDGIVYQSLGLEESGYCVVMPKYVVCPNSSTPWRRAGVGLCRIIRGYGPKGLEKAVRRSRARLMFSPLFGGVVPVLDPAEAVLAVDPGRALIVSRDPAVHLALEHLGIPGRGLAWSLGLTGSRAAGYSHEGSDVDLVAYSEQAALSMLEIFREARQGADPVWKEELGGIDAGGPVDVSWRRTWLRGPDGLRIGVTWVGALRDGPLHCPPIRGLNRSDPPVAPGNAIVKIEPGQASALLYPPCVAHSGGGWIVSYEYNLAYTLYLGGLFSVEGLVSASGRTIYVGTLERPGALRRIREGT